MTTASITSAASTPSPLCMPARRPTPVERPAFTTTTGDGLSERLTRARYRTPYSLYDHDPFCFVCSRVTDHCGEHDALVEAGLAVYDQDGSVLRTADWDEDKAAEVNREEFRRMFHDLA